jgi:hypothetical protein
MCLDRVKQEFNPPLKKEVMAWKLVNVKKGVPWSPFVPFELRFNDWVTSPPRIPIWFRFITERTNAAYYWGGFHVFVNKARAEEAFHIAKKRKKDIKLVRVIVREITTRGVQFYFNHGDSKMRRTTVLVARQIFCFTHLHESEIKTTNQTELALK